MNRPSLDSARPMMAPSVVSSKQAVNRYSTYSNSPSLNSTCTSGSDSTNAANMQEIRHLTQGLDRLENKPLSQQRFVPTEQKSAAMSKLALGAKVERALGRRMTNQDAIYRGIKNSEKRMALISEKTEALKA